MNESNIMGLSETQRTLIQNLLGKARDNNTLNMQREIKNLEEKLASQGFNKFNSGQAINEEFEIRFKYLKNLAYEYMKIYLDVLAPQNSPLPRELLDYISENIHKKLDGPWKGIRQTIDDYKGANKRFNVDEHFKKKQTIL